MSQNSIMRLLALAFILGVIALSAWREGKLVAEVSYGFGDCGFHCRNGGAMSDLKKRSNKTALILIISRKSANMHLARRLGHLNCNTAVGLLAALSVLESYGPCNV